MEENNVDFTIAIDTVNRKISYINMKIIEDDSNELQEELDKWLNIKQEIYKGNIELIKKVVNSEI